MTICARERTRAPATTAVASVRNDRPRHRPREVRVRTEAGCQRGRCPHSRAPVPQRLPPTRWSSSAGGGRWCRRPTASVGARVFGHAPKDRLAGETTNFAERRRPVGHERPRSATGTSPLPAAGGWTATERVDLPPLRWTTNRTRFEHPSPHSRLHYVAYSMPSPHSTHSMLPLSTGPSTVQGTEQPRGVVDRWTSTPPSPPTRPPHWCCSRSWIHPERHAPRVRWFSIARAASTLPPAPPWDGRPREPGGRQRWKDARGRRGECPPRPPSRLDPTPHAGWLATRGTPTEAGTGARCLWRIAVSGGRRAPTRPTARRPPAPGPPTRAPIASTQPTRAAPRMAQRVPGCRRLPSRSTPRPRATTEATKREVHEDLLTTSMKPEGSAAKRRKTTTKRRKKSKRRKTTAGANRGRAPKCRGPQRRPPRTRSMRYDQPKDRQCLPLGPHSRRMTVERQANPQRPYPERPRNADAAGGPASTTASRTGSGWRQTRPAKKPG